jgi:hypothetical protein
MATALEIERLRRDLSLTVDVMPDYVISDLFTEAGEVYTGIQSKPAYVRVLALRTMLVTAAAQVDYTQLETTEHASQYFANLSKLLAFWQDQLDRAVAIETGSGAAFAGTTVRVPVVATW